MAVISRDGHGKNVQFLRNGIINFQLLTPTIPLYDAFTNTLYLPHKTKQPNMRALSIIAMILSILIIIGSLGGYVVAYSSYKNQVYGDFGEWGGMIRTFDSTPYISGGVVGFILLILSIIGMAVSKKKPQPIVNVYQQAPQPQYHPPVQPQQQYHPPQQQQYQQPAQPNYQHVQPQSSINVDAFINQAIQSYNAKDYSNAIAILLRATSVAPNDKTLQYNLACLYSVTNQKNEAFAALSKAIGLGYSNFEKIRTVNDLHWLRSQPEYTDFVRNGYRTTTPTASASTSTPPPPVLNASNDEVLAKLERLGKLKEQGLLTEDEFNDQKKKILNN